MRRVHAARIATLCLGLLQARTLPGSASSARVQATPAQSPSATQADTGLRVFLMTIGQGDEIWEKFGHSAIWVRGTLPAGDTLAALQGAGGLEIAAGRPIDIAYNYGMFDFKQQDFLKRFIRGHMLYWMEGFDGVRLINYYKEANRSVWLQELNLTLQQKLQLADFLVWNAREANKFYPYDYYRDNCSTRVRDALDRVLGGAIRRALAGRATGTTYRFHTSRLSADVLPAYTGLMLGLGPFVDQPIDAWQTGFLPVQLMESLDSVRVPGADGQLQPLVRMKVEVFRAQRPPEREQPPQWTVWYGLAGAALGGLLLLAGTLSRRRLANVLFYALTMVWSLVAGLFGAILVFLWVFTDHVAAYQNENVFQVSVLSLVLFVMLILAARGRRLRGAYLTALAVAVLSVLGWALQALPWMNQVNGPIIALAMPLHLGVAGGLYRRQR